MKQIITIALLSIIISSCKNNEIGKGYELDYDASDEICLINKKKSGNGYDLISITGHILFYGHSKDYIIVVQKPKDSIYNSKENLNYSEQMNKIYKSKFNQFWILKIKNDSLFGPFRKEEYLKKRQEIGVPENFKIDYSTLSFYLEKQRNDIQYSKPNAEIIDVKNLKGNSISN
jgi:hypothetical protein